MALNADLTGLVPRSFWDPSEVLFWKTFYLPPYAPSFCEPEVSPLHEGLLRLRSVGKKWLSRMSAPNFHETGVCFVFLALDFVWSWMLVNFWEGFPGGAGGKAPTCQFRRHKRHGFDPWIRKIPWRRPWQPTPVFLPGESHRQRSLTRYSPCGCKSRTRLSD